MLSPSSLSSIPGQHKIHRHSQNVTGYTSCDSIYRGESSPRIEMLDAVPRPANSIDFAIRVTPDRAEAAVRAAPSPFLSNKYKKGKRSIGGSTKEQSSDVLSHGTPSTRNSHADLPQNYSSVKVSITDTFHKCNVSPFMRYSEVCQIRIFSYIQKTF